LLVVCEFFQPHNHTFCALALFIHSEADVSARDEMSLFSVMVQCPWSQEYFKHSEADGTLNHLHVKFTPLTLVAYPEAMVLARHYGRDAAFNNPCVGAPSIVPPAQPPIASDYWAVVSQIDDGISAMLDKSKVCEVIDLD
jgi:hypothetical protein